MWISLRIMIFSGKILLEAGSAVEFQHQTSSADET
jgi:hypothetical protein